MMDPFATLLAELEKRSGLDSILYIGIQLPDPTLFLSLPAKHIAFAVPGELLPRNIPKTIKQDTRVSFHPVMAGKKKGQAQLSVFNLKAVSASRTPTASLLALFPNLKEERQIEVDVLPLDDLIDVLPAQDASSDLLVIDLPGEEANIVAMLQENTGSKRFGHILLRAGQNVLYEGALSFPELCARLENVGYRSVQRNLDDPDIPCILFRLEPLALKVPELEARLSQLYSAQDKLKSTVEQRDAALAEAAETLKTLKTERDTERQAHIKTQAELSELKKTLEGQLAEMRAVQGELKATVKKRDTALAEAAETLKTLKTERDTERQAHIKTQAELSELKKTLEGQLAEMRAVQGELKATVKKRDTALAEAAEQLNVMKTERENLLEAREEEVTRATELSTKLAQMNTTQEELRAVLAESETRLKDRTMKLAEVEAYVAELERKLARTSLRQRVIEDQVTSAEAQIDVLRDLLRLHSMGSKARTE